MKEYKCSKCNSKDVFMEKRGTQTALICGDCGTWQKWLPANEITLVNRFIESQEHELTIEEKAMIYIAVEQYSLEYATFDYIEWEKLLEKIKSWEVIE